MTTRVRSSPMPTWWAIARAVSPWSPATTISRMPAVWHRATASRTSGRGGSTIPTGPSRVSPVSAASRAGRRRSQVEQRHDA